MPSSCRRRCAVQVPITLAAQEVATPPLSLSLYLSQPSWAVHLAYFFPFRWQRSANDHSHPSYATTTPASAISSVALMSAAPSSTLIGTASVPSTGATASAWGLPSLDLSALLSSPLSATPATKAGPLVISPALPPIPAKIVERVQNGSFIDFKEFLADNVLLVQRLQELSYSGAHLSPLSQSLSANSRLREINDPLTWASCFLAFMATRLELQEARDLAAYGMIILQLARKHGGMGWLVYDRQFRQHRATGASMPWSDINPSLMAATVLGQAGDGSGRSCPLCLAADHSKEECALGFSEQPKLGPNPAPTPRAIPPPSRSLHRPAPYTTGDTICRRFNRGWCTRSTCRFDHICTGCAKPGHGEVHCPDAKVKQRSKINDARSAGLPKPTHPPSERA